MATERVHVSICNQARLPERIVLKAQTEAAYVFSTADIELVWHDCSGGPPPDDIQVYSVRLRGGTPPTTRGPASLDAMGRAFLGDDGSGSLADVFYQAADIVARKYVSVRTDALLGNIIAHEVGHLLLGPGHSPEGIMRAQWNETDMDWISKRWMRFTPDQRARIHCGLPSDDDDCARDGKCQNDER